MGGGEDILFMMDYYDGCGVMVCLGYHASPMDCCHRNFKVSGGGGGGGLGHCLSTWTSDQGWWIQISYIYCAGSCIG